MIMLTTFDLDRYVYAALRAGASGFLLKDVTPEHLAAAVRLVDTGDALLAPVDHPAAGGAVRRGDAADPAEAAVRRTESHRADAPGAGGPDADGPGLSNTELADALTLSEATVKTHVAESSPSSACATALRPSSLPTRPDSFTWWIRRLSSVVVG